MTYEREVIRKHSKSFALAARLLAPAARRRAERLYAWCRFADDAIDNAPTPSDASKALAELRSDLDAVCGGRTPGSAAAGLLSEVVLECDLPRAYPEELLTGMEMDLAGTRYQSLDDILVYAHRVAGVVGLMMTHALGVSDDRAGPPAGQLGIAMQLTNIARDVAEDWQKGRLYLPLDWLGAGPPADLPLDDRLVAPAVQELLAVADQHYAAGDIGLKYLDRRSRLAVRVARNIYSEIGARVRAAGCRPSAGRAVVTTRKKLALLFVAMAQELITPDGPTVRQPRQVWRYNPHVGYTPAADRLTTANGR